MTHQAEPDAGRPRARHGLVEAADAILIIVDLQEGFLKKAVKARAEALVDNVRFLSEAAARLSIPIMVTVEEPDVHGPLHPRIRAVLDHAIAERNKRFFGLCGQDDLRNFCLGQPRRTAILVGLETDVCVLQSAVGLREQGFRALMVSDAVASADPDHGYGLDRARSLGVELIHTKGLYYELARSLAGLKALQVEPRPIPPANIQL